MSVVIETTLGDITVDLFIEERPQTCKNFLKLCKIKYYNFCLFHSIQANFIAQTGDPTGIGTGGESVYGLVFGEESKYYEAEKIPKIKHNKPGLLSMVNYGNNMLGSQFFLTLGTELKSLEEHCVFAEVTEGHDILVKLNDAICDGQHRPYQDIRITHTVILEDPFEDIPGLIVPDASPDITSVEIANGRIGADEKINDEDGLSVVQLQELKEEREAKARATILEIVGDLPHADVAPPENVLFVCKLNPVTTDEELEIIFNRFGKVKSCEVIRDHQTADSLQYAFVEFEDQKSCEQAYLKMDNVLIDDRRIHVDFSQSVSRIKWKGKGRGVQYFDKPDEKESNSTRSSERHFFNKREYYSRDRGDNRERQERDRDRNDRRREDDRRRRGGGGDREQEEYRRRDRRKVEESSRRRGEEEGWREEDGSRKRRDARDERRREEERKYGGSGSSNSRRDDRRREEDKRRDVEKRRNGTEKKDSSSSRRENHMEERKTRAEEKNKEEVKEYKDEVKYETARPKDKERVPSRETAKKPDHEPSNHSSSYKKEEAVMTVSNNVEASSSLNSTILDMTPNENITDLTLTPEKATTSDPKKAKKKKKRKPSSSSESSSSDSSESSSSSSSEQRRKKKRSLTVAKKYYNHRGKVYKIVKKKKNESSTESSEESSDCDSKRRKKVKYKKIVKVIKKRRRTTTDEESETDSSSSDDSEESDRPRRKKKKTEKNSKKKRKDSKKDTKKKKRHGSSDSSKSEEKSSKKKNKMAAESSKKTDDKFE